MEKSTSVSLITNDTGTEKPLSEFNSDDNTIQYLSITSITNRMQFFTHLYFKIYCYI